jgi:hypothetical protein
MNFLKRLFGGGRDELRSVPGALTASTESGRVIYNMLDPLMQRFMGQCVGALKKEGIRAKGTGQFSVRVGENGAAEVILDEFWRRYAKDQDARVFSDVVQAAKKALKQ